MAELAFHSGLTDKLGYACRLLRKAWRQGRRIVVAGEPALLDRLDGLLWTFEAGEFVPHARLRAGQAVAPALQRTPIWLADVPADIGEHDVLVNLGPEVAEGSERFERLIELVGDDPVDVQHGRQRWRRHLAAGLSPVNVKPGAEAASGRPG
jgi:DNA polymerase III subunit chi